MSQAVQGDLRALPWRMLDFCPILGRRVHRPVLPSDLLWGCYFTAANSPCSAPLAFTAAATTVRGALSSGLRTKRAAAAAAADGAERGRGGPGTRSCHCLLFLRLQWVPHPCCHPNRQGNTACPGHAAGATCVLHVAQLDQTQPAQPK